MLTKRTSRRARLIALPLGLLAQRGLFVVLLILATVFLILGQLNPNFTGELRARLVDFIAPVLATVSRPVQAVQNLTEKFASYVDLAAEVDRLRAENTMLKTSRQQAHMLAFENNSLRELLNAKPEPQAQTITVRVIASVGAPFARALIIAGGTRDGVHKNMAVIGADGLIGRVIEAGMWSARVMLLTDPASRVPVMTADGNNQAILAGDNSATPMLRHLPQDADFAAGTQLVTSGQGGVFPPHLPVGAVSTGTGDSLRVLPYANGSAAQFVRLIDYSLLTAPVDPYALK